MQLLDDYFALQVKIYEHFGYVYADSEAELESEEGNFYTDEIYILRVFDNAKERP